MDIITTHTNADFDALASMIAARKLYPDAVLVFPGGQEKNIRDFLLRSTLYVFDIHRARDISLDAVRRLILVDIRQSSRIGKFASLCSSNNCEVHVFDHHPPSADDIKASYEIIKPYGSTTTIMCEILAERNIDLTPEEATVMMLGIYEDTGNLTFSSTTHNDFQAAAYLLSHGANLNIVADMAVKELTADQVAMLNELIENAVTYTINTVDIMLTKATSEWYQGDFAVLVHKLKNMENVDVLFALAAMDDRVYIVGRSRIKEVNVGDVLAAFNGGGHATAASATVHARTLAQVEQELLSVLHKKIRPIRTARDIMTTPVKTIDAETPIGTAGEVLTRYNVNVLPVIDGKRLVGLISRQIVEKAKHHGLVTAPVRDYMVSEFATVPPSASLTEVTQQIIAGNQRFLPVVSGKNITGAITRTDVLRALHLDGQSVQPLTDVHPSPTKKTSLKSILAERLPRTILMMLRDLGSTASEMGYAAYAVGGFVRDILLRFENYDIDIVIEGDGIAFARHFAQRHGLPVKIYRKFGTAVITQPDGSKIDIASSRLEYYERPAALPKVEWSSIKHDLYRRDFTINTLAIRLNPECFGELIDFFGARRDLKEKTIRVLHNLSFVEDPSRIYRAVRFEQRFDFHISKLTLQLIHNAIKLDLLHNLSGKRTFSEIVALLGEEKVLMVIKRLHELRLLRYIHPAIQYDQQLKTLLKNTNDVLSWFTLLYLDNTCETWFVYFLALIDRLQADEAMALSKTFSLKKKYAQAIETAKTVGNTILYRMAQAVRLSNAELYDMLHGIPVEVCLFLMAKTNRAKSKQYFSHYFTKLSTARIHITGEDLIRLGIPPGRIYKRILNSVLQEVLNGRIHGKQEELQFIRRTYLQQTP
ncbi:MAG: CBS domain-containing protein [Desulfobacterota bacterium]|nr:CBS domain-containing protein [Thermodesulfobacteriota bacterium]